MDLQLAPRLTLSVKSIYVQQILAKLPMVFSTGAVYHFDTRAGVVFRFCDDAGDDACA